MHGMEESDEPKNQKYNQQQGTAAGNGRNTGLQIMLLVLLRGNNLTDGMLLPAWQPC